MKKTVMILVIFTIVNTAFTQEKKTKEQIKVDFYGVDFSSVNVVGAREMPEQFIKAFEGINGLLIVEHDKYNVAKYLGLDIISTDCEPAVNEIAKLRNVKFKDKKTSDINIESIVANYPKGVNKSLVVIAKELNKTLNTGIFVAVIYDGSNHKILSEIEFSGKAKGFGLRNFWAGSLYDGLKYFKFSGHKYNTIQISATVDPL